MRMRLGLSLVAGSLALILSGCEFSGFDFFSDLFSSDDETVQTTQTDETTTTTTTTTKDDLTNPNLKYDKTDFTLLAWSESGMHCMDEGYDTFALLPPYSTLKAQLIVKGPSPRIVNGEVKVTYEAVANHSGNLNTSSADKSDFWKYANKLFPKAGALADDVGLSGKPVQSETPVKMDYNITQHVYIAEGIPTVPTADGGDFDSYPTVKVVARDKDDNVLAETTTVLPVSDEMDCVRCHKTRSDVLAKHDRNIPDAVKKNFNKLKAKGFDYDKRGLAVTANAGTPILCVACHKSHAIPGSGIDGIKPLTEAIHGAHAGRSDPDTGDLLGDGRDRSSCYACHPGESTKCLRGAMGKAVNEDGTSKIDCQSCHGNMYAVAEHSRKGWLDEPNCQACHQEGKRYDKAVTDLYKGTLRAATDKRFATEQTVHEPHGPRLYKHSAGHGGVACAGCHGAQHAIYPSSHQDDNAQNIALQGYAGTLRECGVCHKSKMPAISMNGPHGMHKIDQEWVDKHGTIVLRSGTASCKQCHGADLKGTSLSRAGTKRTFKLGVRNEAIILSAGKPVGCTSCHKQQQD